MKKNSHDKIKQKLKGSKMQRGGDGSYDEYNNNEPPSTTVNNFIEKISTILKTNILKVPSGSIEKFTDNILKIIYVLAILSILAVIVCLILYFIFNLSWLGGVSNAISIISFIFSIILLVGMLFKVVVSYVLAKYPDKETLRKNQDEINVFILLIRSISISSYNLLFAIFLGLPTGFLLSLTHYLNPIFFNNIIARFYNITLIISISIIFLGLLSKLFDQKIKQLSLHKINFFVASLTIIIFIAIVNIFKYISDILLDYILTGNPGNIKELFDLGEESADSDDLNKKLQLLTNVFSLHEIFSVDDVSAVMNDKPFWFLFLICYGIYIVTIMVLAFIFIKYKELININSYSITVGNNITEIINKALKKAETNFLNKQNVIQYII
tara:strand:- start:5528 stop:6676 length:1149 start_codon:yes stop_codon:yes gene_type:complete